MKSFYSYTMTSHLVGISMETFCLESDVYLSFLAEGDGETTPTWAITLVFEILCAGCWEIISKKKSS